MTCSYALIDRRWFGGKRARIPLKCRYQAISLIEVRGWPSVNECNRDFSSVDKIEYPVGASDSFRIADHARRQAV